MSEYVNSERKKKPNRKITTQNSDDIEIPWFNEPKSCRKGLGPKLGNISDVGVDWASL